MSKTAKILIELGSLASLVVIVYGLVDMTKSLNAANTAVHDVLQDIATTKQLTVETNNDLTPLAESTKKLEYLNTLSGGLIPKLDDAKNQLAAANDKETKLISVVKALYADTGAAVNGVKGASDLNSALLGINTTSADSAYVENGKLTTLGQLTDISIQQLRELNKKFAPLGSIPSL